MTPAWHGNDGISSHIAISQRTLERFVLQDALTYRKRLDTYHQRLWHNVGDEPKQMYHSGEPHETTETSSDQVARLIQHHRLSDQRM